jgi:NAD(P)-dependent dehydrogenase (short-subunit alcohol dehydrogenase family)
MGQIRHPVERHCTRAIPYQGAWDRLLPGDLAEKFDMAKKVPLGRVGNHQELANLAAYLVSDFRLTSMVKSLF